MYHRLAYPPKPFSRRFAFTITELLVAMALIIFIMVILAEAFTAGLDTFRRLKGIGDMSEELRSATVQIRRDLADAHFEARRVIEVGLRTGKVEHAEITDLKRRYGTIVDEAERLDPQLLEVERATTNPAGKRVMRATRQALAGIKASASQAVAILELIDPDDDD